ncbi:UDP diphosphate synthase [Thermosipho melanesiensis]|uniref:Isoprenyl transferase n=2 Tax=Thermosipho melanesiensis TaxID=46541 RepID=A6LMH7_THEM4|nr:polyprenyl diphosphate synthase [Thermosipho melanesiensis]ABR31128.1 undecaprenyl diphosphate synthase [Thermosipho melanesiensis BI429]APT74219.1 UDP diphosphate synthase [Thermosipho melanesiensis]OOC36789.1 UDP diphosphate synthase [Thermosipho melanesiensis]OOC36980.1 UDP diphosphate synthase [Thermosipho melanesiensis]OOC37732.1 UDP diphosphate synthase [Thermosipho melanesiensis]
MLKHIAFIMDGNGRWAQKRNKPRMYGHYVGAYKIEEVVRWCAKRGVKYTTFYAFSTENWKRPKGEVNFIFGLLQSKISEFYERMNKEGVKLVFSGRLEELGKNIYNICKEYEEKTKNNEKIVVNMAINYGGRAEIVDAVKKFLEQRQKEIDEETFRKFLYRPEVPDPDLIIRTSGEMRLSNFLTWQSAYSELYFTDVLWPDFSEDDLQKALEDYEKRNRKFGGIK